MADRQSRAVPAARMIVNASTASTAHARNTARNRAELVTKDSLPPDVGAAPGSAPGHVKCNSG